MGFSLQQQLFFIEDNTVLKRASKSDTVWNRVIVKEINGKKWLTRPNGAYCSFEAEDLLAYDWETCDDN